MNQAIRPITTTGIALVGASAIAIAPIIPVTAPPDIAIPAPNVATVMQYDLASFHEPILEVLGPLLEGLSPAQLLAALDDLGAIFGAAVNPLFGGLALVVDTLLDGLTQLLAEGVVPVVEALVPVVETLLEGLVPVLETVFEGLSLVVLSLVPVVATLLAGLTPILLPVTVGLGLLLGGLPLVLLPVTVGLGGLLGGLFGVIPLAAPAPAVAEATSFAATDTENLAAAETLTLSMEPAGGEELRAAALPEEASPVAEAAVDPEAEQATAVLTEVQEEVAPVQAHKGLETALAAKEDVAETEETGVEESTGTSTSESASNSGGNSASNSGGNSASNGGGNSASGSGGSDS